MKKIFLLILILVGFNAFAQTEVLNGGELVVCYTDPSRQTITSFELFDHWEMKALIRGSPLIDLGGSQLSVAEKINLQLARIDRLDTQMMLDLKKYTDHVTSHIANYLVTGASLPEIADTQPRVIPQSNCFIERAAIQWRNLLTNQKRFLISDAFYNHPLMTNDVRAGLILHQTFVRRAAAQAIPLSDSGIRYFNYKFATAAANQFDLGTFVKIKTDARMNDPACAITLHQGLNQQIYAKPLYGRLTVCANAEATYGKLKVRLFSGGEIDVSPVEAAVPARPPTLVFHQIGEIQYFSGGTWLRLSGDYVYTTVKVFEKYGERLIRVNPWSLTNAVTILPTQLQLGALTLACDIGAQNYHHRHLTLDANGDLVGCGLITSPTTYTFGTVALNVFKELLTLDGQTLKEVELDDTAALPINGSTVLTAIWSVDPISLNAQGEVVCGVTGTGAGNTLIDGIQFSLDTTRFCADANGVAKINLGTQILSPEFNNLRLLNLLADWNDPSSLPLDNFCKSKLPSFTNAKWGANKSSAVAYVAGSRYFFHLASGHAVYKSDEDVDVIQSLDCNGEIMHQF